MRGTILGVLLVQLINNSLILIGVPSAWQRAAVGLLLVAGVGIQAPRPTVVTPSPKLSKDESHEQHTPRHKLPD